MKQMTPARGKFQRFGKSAKRAVFLAEMDQVIPRSEFGALIEPYSPKAGGPEVCRPPLGAARA